MSAYTPTYWKTELITERPDRKRFAVRLYTGRSRARAINAAEAAMLEVPADVLYADVLYTSARGDQFFGRYRDGHWVPDARKVDQDADKAS